MAEETKTYDPEYFKFGETEVFVYVVETDENYEKSSQVAVFLTEKGAVELCLKLNHYASMAPTCPSIDDSLDLWRDFTAKRAEWFESHPLGGDQARNGFLGDRYIYFKMPIWEMEIAA